jgi:uncharacterized protein DUF664
MPVRFEGPPDELSGLRMFLDEQRAALLRKLDGLTDEQATQRPKYEGIIRENRDILDGVTDLDSVADDVNGRWVLLHLIEELARHAGHADIIRESIDGTKGP